MYEELYEPLPDVEAYFGRIGLATLGGRAGVECTPEFLDELIYAHHCSVPFETLDVNDGHRAPSLAPADLFEKVVVRKRGGYCFELNALFFSLLKALGFDAQASMARVLIRPNPHPPVSHRTTIVHFGPDSYLADVGLGGPMPAFALKLADGFERSAHGQTFSAHAHGGHWWDMRFTGSSGEERPIMRACTLPADEQDFVALSFYQSQSPLSVFRQARRANLRVEGGANDLFDMTYTEFRNGGKTSVQLAGDEELDRVLAEKFGIENWRM